MTNKIVDSFLVIMLLSCGLLRYWLDENDFRKLLVTRQRRQKRVSKKSLQNKYSERLCCRDKACLVSAT